MGFFQSRIRLALALSTLITGLAHGGLYTHKIHSLNLDQGVEGCNQYLGQASQQFAQDAGVTVIGASCEVDNVMGDIDAVIAYSAPQPVDIWSTNDSTYGEQYSFYNSRQECETSLANEVTVIKDLTGLNPFLKFCHRTSQMGPPQYRSRIDAVGKSPIRRFESAATIDHKLVNSKESIDILDRQARELGLLPIAWHEGQSFFHKTLSVAHYEASDNLKRHRLLGKSYLFLPTLEQCQAARAGFEETRVVDWVGVTACSTVNKQAGFQFNLLWWDDALGVEFAVKSTTIPGKHASLEDCLQVGRTVSQELSKGGEPLMGILCGRGLDSKGLFQMEAISKSH